MRTHGIDVSHHQGVIDWPQVAHQGVTFAFVKVTEGHGYTDPRGAANVAAALKAGMLVSPYHFARPGSSSGTDQARRLLGWHTPRPGMLPPMLDLETRDGLSWGEVGAWARECVETLVDGAGQAILYFPASWWPQLELPLIPWIQTGKVWLFPARWGREPAASIPWTFWQSTNNAYVGGIFGRVDADESRLTRAQLEAAAHVVRRPVPVRSSSSKVAPKPAAKHEQLVYTVRAGDSLWRIAARFYGDGGKWRTIAAANRLAHPDRLAVGQRLTIPGKVA